MLDSRRWLWGLLILGLLCRGAWAGESIIGLRLGIHRPETRIVVDLSGPTAYRVGLLASPDRLYIELPPGPGPSTLPLGRGLVRGLALTTDSGLLRLVAELKGPVKVTRADLIHGAQGGRSRRLVVDIAPASAREFAAALGEGPIDSTPPIVLGSPESESAPAPGATPAGETSATAPALATAAVIPVLRPGSTTASGAAVAPAMPTAAEGSPLPAVPAALVWPSSVPRLKPGGPALLPLVYIDPGHGGPDPGTIGHDGTYEKDITLAMAKELQRQLLASGRYRVKLTRESDRFVALRPRFEMARQDHADMFISLHCDSNPFAGARGATVYTLSETASDAEAAALAAKENKADLIEGVDLSKQNSAVTSILIDLAQRETKNRSAAFAELLVHDLGQVTLMLRNSHRFAGFAVLKAPDIPSVLIELGYLSDPQDEALLLSPVHRAKLAGAMLRAIDGYYAEMASSSTRS